MVEVCLAAVILKIPKVHGVGLALESTPGPATLSSSSTTGPHPTASFLSFFFVVLEIEAGISHTKCSTTKSHP